MWKGFLIMDSYIGTILPWACDWAPVGWALCNGQLLNIQQNAALYSLIGVRYGGDGRNNFALPNLCGKLPVGMGRDQYNQDYIIGSTHASNGKVTLTTANVPLAPHSHVITSTATSPTGSTGTVTIPVNIPVNPDVSATLTNVPTNNLLAAGKVGMSPANTYTSSTATTTATLKSFNATGNVTVPAPTVNVASTCAPTPAAPTAGIPFDINPNTLCINYIICMEGLYPQRP